MDGRLFVLCSSQFEQSRASFITTKSLRIVDLAIMADFSARPKVSFDTQHLFRKNEALR